MKVIILCDQQLSVAARDIIGMTSFGEMSTAISQIQVDSSYRNSNFFQIVCLDSKCFVPKNRAEIEQWVAEFCEKQSEGDYQLYVFTHDKYRFDNADTNKVATFQSKRHLRDLLKEFVGAQRWQVIQILRYER